MDKKITVIGAGNVGATVLQALAIKDLVNEIVVVDVADGVAQGKALDIWQTSSIFNFNSRTVGVTNDYEKTAGSSVIIVTAGIPRKPGMSRDDLIKTNASIVKEVTEKAVKYSPDAILLVVSNPLDVMTYAAKLASKKHPNQVFGMAGVLDVGRYKAFLANELNVSPLDIQALLLGGHGDTMVPLKRYTTVGGIPVTDLIDDDVLDKIIQRTMKGGGEIVNLLGTSAWYAPGASVALMVESILRDQRRVFPVCAYLDGQYGMKDICMGVPVIMGRNGIEKIIELNLNDEERELLENSAKAVKNVMNVLDDLKLF